MAWDYAPLYATLHRKGNMSITQLREKLECSFSTTNKIQNNKPVSMEILDRICDTLEVPLDQVVIHVPNKKEAPSQ